MPVLMIVTCVIREREAFLSGYGAKAGKLVEAFGGKYLLRGRGATLLEGDFGENASMLISEWPDKASAERFWESPEYAAIKSLRYGIADCQVLLIEMDRLS